MIQDDLFSWDEYLLPDVALAIHVLPQIEDSIVAREFATSIVSQILRNYPDDKLAVDKLEKLLDRSELLMLEKISSTRRVLLVHIFKTLIMIIFILLQDVQMYDRFHF